ncbi:MAG: hypothetical protein HGB12_01420 [Bacteroidetes bacterium]|nr:hypothetical protein [Bacteroidota bacterium]
MKKIFLIILLLPFAAFCQITDNFTDGDFANSPVWTGDISKFEVNSAKQLHLNSTGTDTSILCTSSSEINNTEWNFWVKLSFQTSGNNNARVYIVSDQQDITASLNGYFVQVGETNDSISLYKQTGTSVLKIIHGTVAYTNNSTNTLRIKVTRDNSGNWSLYSDPIGGTAYQLEGTATDNTFTTTSWFGVYCKYSSSNATKFYFDDFYVGPIIVDNTPPTISSVQVLPPSQVDVLFSEPVKATSAQNTGCYSVNNGINNPSSAVVDGTNGALVHLTFASTFAQGNNYTITINNVQDLSNNVMNPDSRVFSLFTSKAYDVIINEIFADESPQVGLPAYEFVELYNRTSSAINLKNWKLIIGTSAKVLPSTVIEPDSFLIITSSTGSSAYATYGTVASLSSFSLTNSGQTLTLTDSLNHILHTVTYSDTWYQDGSKSGGGWSLEMIDPSNPCGDELNWSASINPNGGTPGSRNSIYSSNPDNTAPQLTSINVITTSAIQLNFSESIDSTTLSNPAAYSIDNSIGTPTAVDLIGPDYKKVLLSLSSSLQPNILYTCTVTDTIRDCAGNYTVTTGKPFALYNAKQFDVVINEIMADPEPQVSLANFEYVELYNRTAYPVSMKNWQIQLGTTTKTIPDATINPNSYMLLTSTTGVVAMSAYGQAEGISSFSISNSGEAITLLDSSNTVISTVSFTDDWYQDTYKKEGGWSLEQIDPLNPCGGAENWRASISPTGGTPGVVNSINASNTDNTVPQLVRVSLINNNKIEVFFNEPLDVNYLMDFAHFNIDHGISPYAPTTPVSPDYRSVILDFSPSIQAGIIYTLTILDTLKDCVGNILPFSSSARFAIPQAPVLNDVLINEVLSNPGDAEDYVELYNISDKVIELKDLVLASYDTVASILTDAKDISLTGYLMFPKEYLVLTTDPDKVKKQYYTPNPNNFVQMASLPPLNNDNGIVVLSLKYVTAFIDKFIYTPEMFYPLLNSSAGVSLERINFNRPTEDKTNWHSAAETAGFGTPAFINSQYSEGIATASPVSVSPEIFSPDNDGKDDVLNINFVFDIPGYMVNITIYDAYGRLVRNLVKNELLGTSGTFSWDGITQNNEKARIGIYVIYFEVFDLTGNVKHYKLSAVLASKL